MVRQVRALLEKYAKNAWVQVGALALLIILYAVTKVSIFGILFAILLVGTVALEVFSGAKSRGWKAEAKDTAISLAAIAVLWLALGFILNSPVPINAVVSCSMLPNVERGDLILVQGTEPSGYEITLSESELAALQSDEVLVGVQGMGTFSVNGSIYSYCAQHRDSICDIFSSEPELFSESRGPFTFSYASCERHKGGIILVTPCVDSVSFGGKSYYANLSHDTIVYGPGEGNIYYYTGDIIHRVFFKVTSGGETYYLTKGDNNPIFDVQVYDYSLGLGNDAPSSQDYKGKILFRAPVLGYPKLFISGFFSETTNCDSTLNYTYVS
jgi:signal peptidase I